MLAIFVFYVACMWRIFEKAGKPGWLSIIPIVNLFMLVEIAGKEWWWFVLLFIPVVNFFASIIIIHGVSENFGHGIGFTLGLYFLSFIFYPVLAFGDSQYVGKRKRKVNYA